MRRADFNSDAEYYRRHREVFVLAQELRCTPNDAERELQRRERQQCAARLEAKINAPIVPGLPELRSGHDPDEQREPWWQRD